MGLNKKTITDILNTITSVLNRKYKSPRIFMSEIDETKTGNTNQSDGLNKSTDPLSNNDTDTFLDRIKK